jgi:chorismate mutase/prephenate dehydratase
VTLEEIREKLDALDDKLLEIYNSRFELVLKVGEIKNKLKSPIYRPEREKQIIERLKEKNKEMDGVLNSESIEALFMELFSVARNFELPERVAFLGPEASFTHQAAEMKFGALGNYQPIHTIKGVFREVANGKAKFGVVPIENSFNGIVSDTISCLSDYDLKIVAEVVLSVHHVLASREDDIKKIKRIYSKDIAFGQCSKFLEDFGLDNVEQIPVESTAKAAQLAKEDPESAAICAEVAAKMYDLPILFRDIEDSGKNRTRFFIISDFENDVSGNGNNLVLKNNSNTGTDAQHNNVAVHGDLA